MKTKTSKKNITNSPPQPTQKELKTAYQLVGNDLFNQLVKVKDGQSIWLGKLGSFTKTEHQLKSALDHNTYVYYKVKFKMFKKLKEELNQQLSKKYAKPKMR